MLCCLCLPALTACSAVSPEPRIEYRVVAPAAHLLADCPVPEWAGGEWADLVDLAEARRAALVGCNADKAAVRGEVEAAIRTFGARDSMD